MRGTDQRVCGSRAILAFLVVVGTGLAVVPLHPVPAPAAGVVGTGTPESCTEAALDAALAGGGLVTFDCGAEPIPITVTATKAIAADTAIDGADLITIVLNCLGPAGECPPAFRVEASVTFTLERLALPGIANDGGTVRITDSIVNAAAVGVDTRGGFVSAARTLFDGGLVGISNDGGSVTVTGSTFGNFPSTGIQNVGGAVHVTGSTFAGFNGILNGETSSATGIASIANSTFSTGMCPYGCGGAAVVNNGSLIVTNVTVRARAGLAIVNEFGDVLLRNTIVVGSCGGKITDAGHNIEAAGPVTGDGASCGFDAAHGSLNVTDPRLDASEPQDHGGPTQTFALLPGSPAIDAGDAAACAESPVNDLDQRGYVRPGLGHAVCSIGAYEADAMPPAVPCTGDCEGDGVVAINELILGVNIVLDLQPLHSCPAFANADGMVDIAQLVKGVNSALEGCPACGNGRLDGDETCDDGNSVGGDGCAANCTGEDRRTYLIAGGTCVGGANDGASCQTKDDCPGGVGPALCASATVQAEVLTIPLLLAGREVLTTGRARASDRDGTLPVVIKAADVHFDPVRLVGLECVCVRAVAMEAFGPGNAGVGEIGCGAAGSPDIDISSSRDHDISDVDPTCATGTLDPISNACIGPLNITRSGGPGPRGSAVIRLSVGVEEIPDGGTCATETQTTVCQGGPNPGARCFGGCDGECVPAKGSDGMPCTADDPVVAAPPRCT